MQNGETPRSFPQPSRKYDGEFLDPLLVDEDYEETVGIVRRFARGNPDFNEERILAHLAANGVTLYGTQEDWDALFAEMREKIVADGAEKKPPVEITWVKRQLGGVAIYAMVEVSTAETAADRQVVVPVARVEVSRGLPDKELSIRPDTVARPLAAITEILERATGGRMRPHDLTKAVAARLRVDLAVATDLINAALFTEQIAKAGSKGTTYIVVGGSEPIQRRRKAAQPEANDSEERLLTEGELATVIAVLDKLAEGHVTTGETIKNLERQLNSDLSRDQFRRLLRVLESQRLIRFDNDANYGKARKSPRVHLRGQDTKNRWQANRAGYINRLRQAKIRLKGEA